MRLPLLLALLAPAGGDYLPLQSGTRWVYEVGAASTLAPDAPEPAREVTSEVTTAATLPDGGWTELSNFLGYETCWARTTDAAVEIRTEAVENAPILPILRLPARAGDAWSGTLGRE